MIQIITIGHKMPDWIKSGFHHYHKRLQIKCNLIEIPPLNHKKAVKYLNQLACNIALHHEGIQLSSEAIAKHTSNYGKWMGLMLTSILVPTMGYLLKF